MTVCPLFHVSHLYLWRQSDVLPRTLGILDLIWIQSNTALYKRRNKISKWAATSRRQTIVHEETILLDALEMETVCQNLGPHSGEYENHNL
jgi:hypothetical protein